MYTVLCTPPNEPEEAKLTCFGARSPFAILAESRECLKKTRGFGYPRLTCFHNASIEEGRRMQPHLHSPLPLSTDQFFQSYRYGSWDILLGPRRDDALPDFRNADPRQRYQRTLVETLSQHLRSKSR